MLTSSKTNDKEDESYILLDDLISYKFILNFLKKLKFVSYLQTRVIFTEHLNSSDGQVIRGQC